MRRGLGAGLCWTRLTWWGGTARGLSNGFTWDAWHNGNGTVAGGSYFFLIRLEPQSRFGEGLLGIRVNLSPKRDCGSKRVESPLRRRAPDLTHKESTNRSTILLAHAYNIHAILGENIMDRRVYSCECVSFPYVSVLGTIYLELEYICPQNGNVVLIGLRRR